MGIVLFGLVVAMMAPVAAIAWYFAIHKPAMGRKMQDAAWKPLAARLGGRWVPSPGGSRFHTFVVPYGTTEVMTIVFDRAAIDPAVAREHPTRDFGGWRTFVQAPVVGGPAPAWVVTPRHRKGGLEVGDPTFQQHHHATALLATPPDVIATRLTPQLSYAFGVLGARYTTMVAGPAFVSLEIPGICADPTVLEAAVHVVGSCAQPSAAAAPAQRYG